MSEGMGLGAVVDYRKGGLGGQRGGVGALGCVRWVPACARTREGEGLLRRRDSSTPLRCAQNDMWGALRYAQNDML